MRIEFIVYVGLVKLFGTILENLIHYITCMVNTLRLCHLVGFTSILYNK